MSTLPTMTWFGIPGEQISNIANSLRISYYQKANRKNKSRFAISVSKRFKSKKKNKFERHCRPLEQKRRKEVLVFFQYLFYRIRPCFFNCFNATTFFSLRSRLYSCTDLCICLCGRGTTSILSPCFKQIS